MRGEKVKKVVELDRDGEISPYSDNNIGKNGETGGKRRGIVEDKEVELVMEMNRDEEDDKEKDTQLPSKSAYSFPIQESNSVINSNNNLHAVSDPYAPMAATITLSVEPMDIDNTEIANLVQPYIPTTISRNADNDNERNLQSLGAIGRSEQNEPKISDRNIANNSQSSVQSPFQVGDLVEVASRSWAGINRPGGVGRVTKIYEEVDEGDGEEGTGIYLFILQLYEYLIN